MIIVETSAGEYDHLFGGDTICFNKAAFNALNGYKCDEVRYLLFRDNKLRLGLVAGVKGKQLLSPFSAPFGGFSVLDDKLSVQHIEDAVDVLKSYCVSGGIEGLSMTLPPLFYNESFLTKVQQVLFQKDFEVKAMDLNYVFRLKQMSENYVTEVISEKARRNLKIGLTRNMSFRVGKNNQDLMTAYEIIRENRVSRGFALSMSADEVAQAAKLVQMDSFVVGFENKDIASAIVYHVTDKILQLIYWGDLPQYALNKTMNFLAYKVFEYYNQKGYETIDVGTAMLGNKPNYGLCVFKESIGCSIQPKCSFSIKF